MPENGETGSGSSRGSLNPFARHESHSGTAIVLYRITTFASYIIFLITTIYYTFHVPGSSQKDDSHRQSPNHRIWGQNRPSPFAQNSIMTSIYWLVTWTLQLGYIYTLWFSSSEPASDSTQAQIEEEVRAPLTPCLHLAPHFISSNLLLFGFIHLFTRSHLWLALLLVIINFFNLSLAYFRFSASLPRLLHTGVLSAPLAWNFVALYWVGALAVHAHHLAARIVGNVFIWGFVAYGGFFLAAFKDYSIGMSLSVLSFSTAVGQFLTKLPILQLQWIFAFAIGGLLFVASIAIGMPEALGREPVKRGLVVNEDRERAPLLADA